MLSNIYTSIVVKESNTLLKKNGQYIYYLNCKKIVKWWSVTAKIFTDGTCKGVE